VRLLEVEPDLGSALEPEELRLAAQLALPLITVPPGDLTKEMFWAWDRAFGAILLNGMLRHRITIGEQAVLTLLGPGDIVMGGAKPGPAMVADGGYRAAAVTELAVLEDHMLLGIRRFPQLAVALHRRMAAQHERLAAQLAICQLPRVEDRVLAVMWLLAESWGRVTLSGTMLPVSLTHDLLGELVGAKRPTVTLAVRDLRERGALMRTDQGWLLLEAVIPPDPQPLPNHEPAVIDSPSSRWADPTLPARPFQTPARGLDPAYAREMLRGLRERYARGTARHASQIKLADATREQSRRLRARINQDRRSRRAPS
jgi:hypothetical protein